MDKEAFLKGNVEHDPEDKVVVFDRSPNYVEVVAKVRIALNWTEVNDIVCLERRHNIGFGPHSRWKIMPINPYSRGYASDSEDDILDEEVDEDGFAAK